MANQIQNYTKAAILNSPVLIAFVDILAQLLQFPLDFKLYCMIDKIRITMVALVSYMALK